MDKIRVRFAPSPTGFLHVGGLRTALYNYLYAKKHQGKIILRIEDTDQSRYVPGAVENLIRILEWVGLDFDEGPHLGGSFGPYTQSERLELYKEYAQELLSKGFAYRCFCSSERLDEMRKSQQKISGNVKYDRMCLKLEKEEIEKRVSAGLSFTIRLKIPDRDMTIVNDIIRGKVEFQNEIIDDQVLIKSDGYPTYHLANVVDDHLMQVSHVIRGEEWLSSTPKHVILYEFFNWELPQFAHLPLLLNPDKSKLSKRQGDVAVEDYREKGYCREALINFIALLGWNAGDDKEFYQFNELIEKFSLERVSKSGAVFSVDKLNWLNAEHLKKKPNTDILKTLKDLLAASKFKETPFEDEYLIQVIDVMRERITFVKDLLINSSYFFEIPAIYDTEVIQKRWQKETPVYLGKLVEEFAKTENPSKADYEAALRKTADEFKVKPAMIIHPVRLALSGVGGGPGLFDLLFVLGRNESIKRINRSIEKISVKV